jgi:hypothetical protein
VDVTDPRAVLRSWQATAVGEIMRAIEMGIFDDPADARAYLRDELSPAEWAHVDGWYALRTSPPPVDVPF